MMLPMVFSPILILVYQISFDLGRFITLRYSGPLSFISSGRLDNQSLKRSTGSVFPPSVEYIACGVVLRDIVRPPLRVLVGPSRNSTTSLPSSCCLITKSSRYEGVIVLLATSKSKLLSQVFEVNIGQDLSVKITKLTF